MSRSQDFQRPPPSAPRGWNAPYFPPQPPAQDGMPTASHPGSANTWSWGSTPHHLANISGHMHTYHRDAPSTQLTQFTQPTQATQPTSHPLTQNFQPGGSYVPSGHVVDMSEYQRGLADGRLLATLDRLECEVSILRKSLERSSVGSGVLAGRLPLAGLEADAVPEDGSRRVAGTAAEKVGPVEQPWVPAAVPQHPAPSQRPAALYGTAFHTPPEQRQPLRPPALPSSVPSNYIYRPRHGTTSSSFANTSQRPAATFQQGPPGYTEHLRHVTNAVDRDERRPTTTVSSRPTVRRSQGGRTGGRGRTHDLLQKISAMSQAIVLDLESGVKTEATSETLRHLVPSIRESLSSFIESCMEVSQEDRLDLDQSVAESVVHEGEQDIQAIKSRMVERLSGLFKSSRGPSWKLTKNWITPRAWSTLQSVRDFERELRRQHLEPVRRVNDETDALQATSTCIKYEPGPAQDDSASVHESSRSQTLCDAGWTPGKSGGAMVDEWIESEGEEDESAVDSIESHCEEIDPRYGADQGHLETGREIRKTRSDMSLVEAASQVARPRSRSDAQLSAPAWREMSDM